MRRVEEKREERRTLNYLKESDGDGRKGEGRGKERYSEERGRAIGLRDQEDGEGGDAGETEGSVVCTLETKLINIVIIIIIIVNFDLILLEHSNSLGHHVLSLISN